MLPGSSRWNRAAAWAVSYTHLQLPCGYSVTVQLDVTRFRAMLERKGLKFYPSFIWCVSHTILSHPAFRMGVDSEGQPGTYDRMRCV